MSEPLEINEDKEIKLSNSPTPNTINSIKDMSSPLVIENKQSLNKEDEEILNGYIKDLLDSDKREKALTELCKRRESFTELAYYLWYTPGVVAALLQEIITMYQYLAPPKLDDKTSSKIYNILALFQCIASHTSVRRSFVFAQIPIFLYPFLNTINKSKQFEYLRLTALGVIGALVKVDSPEIINFLLTTEIIPLCLRIMERGSEVSKTVATFIIQRILLDDNGLSYICNTAERFYAVS